MIAAPTAAPIHTIVHGNSPPNIARDTAAISVACGASSGFGCSAVGTPMPRVSFNRFSTGAITSAHEIAPIASITCWRHGVAPMR